VRRTLAIEAVLPKDQQAIDGATGHHRLPILPTFRVVGGPARDELNGRFLRVGQIGSRAPA
jgi:hypothetical protein